jgi:tripeptidyl-peptidase-1
MKLWLAIVIGLVASVTAAPTTSYEVHEKREFTNPVWVPRQIELNKRAIIPISIGLTQQNLENGHEFLMDVSDPTSPNYSSHWTPERVGYSIQPNEITLRYSGCRSFCPFSRNRGGCEGVAV